MDLDRVVARDFRAGDDAQLATVAAQLTDGVTDTVMVWHYLQPDAGGGGAPSGDDAALVGATVTLFRRKLASLVLSPAMAGTRTSTDFDVTWEVWGCR